jgi:hypothetical protein
MPSQI